MPGVPIISVISAISKAVEVVGVRIGTSISISFSIGISVCLGIGDSTGPTDELRRFPVMSMVVTMVAVMFLAPCLAHKLGGFPMMSMVVPMGMVLLAILSVEGEGVGEGTP